MINYSHEHRPRGGNNGFIGNGRFRHYWQVAIKAEQRKDYEQAYHYYGEAEKAAKAANNDKHRTHAANRKDACERALMAKNDQYKPVQFAETGQAAPVAKAKQPELTDITAALKTLLNR